MRNNPVTLKNGGGQSLTPYEKMLKSVQLYGTEKNPKAVIIREIVDSLVCLEEIKTHRNNTLNC